jgi:hypothetical protein
MKNSLRMMCGLWALALLMVTLPAQACYSGLLLIPTADLTPPGTCVLDLQADGPVPDRHVDLKLINTEFGLTDRLEAGIDFDVSKNADTDAILNAKYVLATYHGGAGAVAVGVCNMGNRLKANPYLVASQDLKALRGHAGIIRIEKHDRWFVGADTAVTEKVTLMGDYINGKGNYSSAGVNYAISDRLAVLGGLEFPNDGGATRFTVQLVITGAFRRAQKE